MRIGIKKPSFLPPRHEEKIKMRFPYLKEFRRQPFIKPFQYRRKIINKEAFHAL